jgi:hypothetical protein
MVASGCSHAKSEATPSRPSATPAHLPAAQVDRLESDLASGKLPRLRRAIELPPHQKLDPSLVTSLRGLTIEFEPETAVVAGDNQVSVKARVTGEDGQDQEWLVTLDQQQGQYVVADTHLVQP